MYEEPVQIAIKTEPFMSLDRIAAKIQSIASLTARWCLFAAIAWIVIDYVALGKFSLFIAGDNISVIPYLMAFPARGWAFANWSPFAAAGTDFTATGYTPLVFRWLFALLPGWAAVQVLVVVPIIAAVIGVRVLAMRTLGLGAAAATFAGFAYGVLYFRELFFLTSMLGYLPLTILALGRVLDDKSQFGRWVFLIGIGFLMAHSSFITRLVPWPVATLLVWFLFVDRRRRVVDWVIIILFSAALMASRWQDIVALMAYAPTAAIAEMRTGGTLALELSRAVDAIVGCFTFGNFVPMIFFAGLAWAIATEHPRGASNIAAGAIGLIVLFFVGIAVKVAVVSFLPFMKGYNLTYVLQGFNIFSVLAGAIAFQVLSQKPGIPILVLAAVTLLLVEVNLERKYWYARNWISWGNLYQNTEAPDLAAVAVRLRGREQPARMMSFQMQGNLLNAYGIETIESFHPVTSKRYLDFVYALHGPWRRRPEWQTMVRQTDQTGAMTSIVPATKGGLGWTRAIVASEWRLADYANLNLASLAGVAYIASRDRLVDESLTLVSGPERSWSTLSRREKIMTNLKANFSGKRHVFIYENPAVLPRAFSADTVHVFADGAAVLDAMSGADLETLGRTVFVAASDIATSLKTNAEFGRSTVTMRTYEADRIVLDVTDSERPTLVVVTNSYSPYWHCRVDGAETPIFPADNAFWGIALPAGAKEVVFEYQAPYRF